MKNTAFSEQQVRVIEELSHLARETYAQAISSQQHADVCPVQGLAKKSVLKNIKKIKEVSNKLIDELD